MANSKYPTEFLLENLQIQNNLLTCANKYNLKEQYFWDHPAFIQNIPRLY